MAKTSSIVVEQFQLSADPTTPASGYSIIYPKTNGKWYYKNSSGTVVDLSAIVAVLTGFSAAAGTVADTDTILQAFNKIVGNIALKASLDIANTFTAKQTISGVGELDSRLVVHTLEIQPYALNNVWIAENAYYGGGAGLYLRANGAAGIISFQGDECQFKFYPSGTAGDTLANIAQLKINHSGAVAIGGSISLTNGTYTGAVMIVGPSAVKIPSLGGSGVGRAVVTDNDGVLSTEAMATSNDALLYSMMF